MTRRIVAQARWVVLVAILVALGPSVPARIGGGGSTARGTIRHGIMRPHRNADGSIVHTRELAGETTNWSGYVVSKFNSGTPYTAAQGSWVVPSVTYGGTTASEEDSSNWVGIGGNCSDAACDPDQTLIQLGTESDALSNGGHRYYAWYEMLPADSITLPNPVSPGDVMTAALQCVASCSAATQTWQLSMVDQTQGWTFAQNFSYASSELSAEWIVEAPSDDNNNVFALADFSRSTFNSSSANGVNPQFNLSLDGLQMDDSKKNNAGQTANPSAPSAGDAFSVCWSVGPNFAPCSFDGTPPQVAPQLAAAMLPSSRSVEANLSATAFATIVNPGSTPGESCTIAPTVTPTDTIFSFQTTDPATNHLTGTPNTPVTIAAGGSQTFAVALTSGVTINPTTVDFFYTCQGQLPAGLFTGVNTLGYSASPTPVPDMVALVATASGDGTLHIAGSGGIGAFAMASDNAGSAGALTVSVNTGGVTLPLNATVCQTNPATGQCLASPAASIPATVAAGAQPTFSVFATATGAIPFVPGTNRIFVQFADSGGAVRGSASVAVATQ